ncbi:class I SAM-dependent methyltransferase [Chelatococcus asaccharovorans]|uniref:SAM-dependent MidA family methyltransferase n=1 Tax=Chelatococcus asaccharovorans TaxID=28210 RepID=A0A2V3U1P1_9HYPH|nr:SAM-dependent methyltransferase [Chelatococcus asaccharovorans]PXW55712.1 SAM-dependent MidA family methyltransferase [Chelatococcus asaccharovorans]
MSDTMPEPDTPLGRELKQLIALHGPISVEAFMAVCLGHPRHGYYMTRDPLGASGDFVTAPEISQMFGELLGLWAAETWRLMGAPATVNLVELGPGRGTLMADTVRVARVVPGFREALAIHLVETSPVLRARQEATLADAGDVVWHASVDTLPDGPAIILANEFFDALPVRQFLRTEQGWHERLVGLNDAGELTFGIAAAPSPEITTEGPVGALLEVPRAGLAVTGEIAARLVAQGGALLAIDYGHMRSGFGDTLQAVRAHRFVDVLATPGEADLTTHVDFALIGKVGRLAGAAQHGPTTQGEFLTGLGIRERAAVLKRKLVRREAEAIDQALARLVEGGGGVGARIEAANENGTDQPEGMGQLFKVIALADPALPLLPGFSARIEPVV